MIENLDPESHLFQPELRTDVHNAEIDERLAAQHLCGTQNLATGRSCHRPERHTGGCAFAEDDHAN